MIDRRRALIGSARLPAEYQEVEYIESVEPGCKFVLNASATNKPFSAKFKCYVPTPFEYSQWGKRIFALNNSWNTELARVGFSYNYSSAIGSYIRVNSSTTSFGESITVDTPFIIAEVNISEQNIISATVNQVEITSGTTEAYVNANIMTINFAKAGVRFYELKATIQGADIAILIPAYRKSDEEVGFFNLTTNTFHTNQGSGSLTWVNKK